MPPETDSTSASSPHAPTHPMQHGHRPASSAQVPGSLVPEAGWHFLHVFYTVDRAKLAALSSEARAEGRRPGPDTLPITGPARALSGPA